MTDMIERVARALCTHHYEKIVGGSIAKHIHMLCNVEQNWPRFVDAAKVAIEAMRDPTDSMKVAGGLKCESIMFENDPEANGIIFHDMGLVFGAMIDAALKPETIERSER